MGFHIIDGGSKEKVITWMEQTKRNWDTLQASEKIMPVLKRLGATHPYVNFKLVYNIPRFYYKIKIKIKKALSKS